MAVDTNIQAVLEYETKNMVTDDLGVLLEESIQSGNYRQFVSLVESIDWTVHRPDELLKAIDLALSLEMTRLAARLAELGRNYFPDHEQVQQAAKVLAAPGHARVTRLPRATGLADSRTWLRDHAGQYRGQWVAVREGELLGAAQTLEALSPVIGEGEDAVSTIVTRVL